MAEKTPKQQEEEQAQAQQNEPTAAEKKQAQQEQGQPKDGPVLAKDVNTLVPEPGDDVGEAQVQEMIDRENAQGFRGIKVDPTPNENYAASNSAPENDLPTPETDQDLRREAAASRNLNGPAGY